MDIVLFTSHSQGCGNVSEETRVDPRQQPAGMTDWGRSSPKFFVIPDILHRESILGFLEWNPAYNRGDGKLYEVSFLCGQYLHVAFCQSFFLRHHFLLRSFHPQLTIPGLEHHYYPNASTIMKNLKNVLIYTVAVFLTSLGYFLTIYPNRPGDHEHETFLREIGEVFGTLGIWALVIIYGRTMLKLAIGQGGLAQRLVPDEYDVSAIPLFQPLLKFLNNTHVFVGIAAIAVILLHIALVGLHAEILFFPAVLVLVVWQGVFGFFLTWRFSPQELKKASYFVHAQFLTGIMIGIFSLFGHLLVDD